MILRFPAASLLKGDREAHRRGVQDGGFSFGCGGPEMAVRHSEEMSSGGWDTQTQREV